MVASLEMAKKPRETTHVERVEQVEDTSPWRCLLQNPKVVLWTLYANLGSTLVGYENLVLSVCLSMPAFQYVKFGEDPPSTFASDVNGTLIIPAHWQSAWNAMYNVGIMLGSLSAGYIQDRLGRRAVFLSAIIISSAGIAASFLSAAPPHFLAGKIVTGFAMGLILTTTQTYVSEISPVAMRSVALSTNTVMLNLGMLIAISSTFSRISIMDDSAFRVLFAAAWAFPGILLAGLPFLPESPYWLALKGKEDKARINLRRLAPQNTPDAIIDHRFLDIKATLDAERALAEGNNEISFLECFRGTNWRRTRIILICFYMPQVVGAVLSSNAPYFLNQTGLPSETVVALVQVGISMGLLSSLVNFFLLMKFKHRPLMFSGVVLCVVIYLIMGIAGTLPRNNTTLLIIGISLQFTSLSYGPAVGAAMAVGGEVSASTLRSKSLGVGTASQFLASTIWTIVLPYLFNQDQADLGGNIGWIFFGKGLLFLAALYYDVPGTKGRSYEELDVMFGRRVPAREFEGYVFGDGDKGQA